METNRELSNCEELSDMQIITFARRQDFERMRQRLEELSLPFETLTPDPGWRRAGAPAIVIEAETLRALYAAGPSDYLTSGRVGFRPAKHQTPETEPPAFDDDVFGEASVMGFTDCVADRAKTRMVAHISGDLAPALPYLNAVMPEASYNHEGQTLTFMDGPRMVCLYPHRIAAAKTDDISDVWRLLETVRVRVNEVWAHRAEIEPSYAMRQRPPALEILKRLPKTNCRACGDATCIAFAVRVWNGDAPVTLCRPVFEGDFGHLREALVEICSGLGVSAGV